MSHGFDNFNRGARRIGAGFVAAWVLCLALSVGFLGVIAWAIVRVVEHYT